MRSTHTYTILKISAAAHAEIKGKLLAVGYSHAIDGETVDMQGIAVEPESPEELLRCAHGSMHPLRERHGKNILDSSCNERYYLSRRDGGGR